MSSLFSFSSSRYKPGHWDRCEAARSSHHPPLLFFPCTSRVGIFISAHLPHHTRKEEKLVQQGLPRSLVLLHMLLSSLPSAWHALFHLRRAPLRLHSHTTQCINTFNQENLQQRIKIRRFMFIEQSNGAAALVVFVCATFLLAVLLFVLFVVLLFLLLVADCRRSAAARSR